ncbi:MAG: hypothetical protein ACHQJ6_04185 [Candidatus Berkiellales bacterium]
MTSNVEHKIENLENSQNKEFKFRQALICDDAATADQLFAEVNIAQLTAIGETTRQVLKANDNVKDNAKDNYSLARLLLKNIFSVIAFEPENKEQRAINACSAQALKAMLDHLDQANLTDINAHTRKAMAHLYERLKPFMSENSTASEQSIVDRPGCIQKLMSTLNDPDHGGIASDPLSPQARCFLPSNALRSVGSSYQFPAKSIGDCSTRSESSASIMSLFKPF